MKKKIFIKILNEFRLVTSVFLILFFLFSIKSFSQAPKGIQYQAIARDFAGNPLPNQSINVKFDLHDGAATGTVVFTETHSGIITNSFGLFNLVIGSQNPVSFQAINWSNGNKFIETLVDLGSGFVSISNTQLMSVPYALYAETSGNSTSSLPNGTTGQVLSHNGSSWDTTSALLINPSNYILSNRKLGIGIIPGLPFQLDVSGNSRISGLLLADSTRTSNFRMLNGAGAGKVLTSDFLGNASWQTPPPNNFWGLSGNTGTNASNYIGTNDAVPFQIFTKGSQRIFIDTNGRVGIGNSNPSYLLHTSKTSSLNNDISGVFDMISFATGSSYGLSGNIYGTGSGSFTGILANATGTSTGAITGIFSQVTGNGNGDKIGIKSDILGSAGTTFGIQSFATGPINDTTYAIYGRANGSPQSFALYTDTGKVFFRDSLGIGIKNPTTKLDVNGSAWIRNNLKVSSYTLPNGNGTSGQVLTTLGNGTTAWTNAPGGGISLPNGTNGQFLYHNGTQWDTIRRSQLCIFPTNNFIGMGTIFPYRNIEIQDVNPSLGIITNSPSGVSTLDFSQNTSAVGDLASIRYDHGANRMYFRTLFSDRMYIDGAGNLAIGNLSAVISGLNLGQNNSISFEGSTNDGVLTNLSVVNPTTNHNIILPNASGTVMLDPTVNVGDMIFRTAVGPGAFPIGNSGDVLSVGAGNLPSWTSLSSLLPSPVWVQSGSDVSLNQIPSNVGIGTSTPSSALTVASSNALISEFSSSDFINAMISIQSTNSNVHPSINFKSGSTNNGRIFVKTDGSFQFTDLINNISPINYDGSTKNLGIKITNPSSTFSVDGTFALTNIYTAPSGGFTLSVNATDPYAIFLIPFSNVTMILPAASLVKGRIYTIKQNGLSSITTTIQSAGGNVEGVGTYTLTGPVGTGITLVSDGNNWWIISKI